MISEADASPTVFEGYWQTARDLEHRINVEFGQFEWQRRDNLQRSP